MAKLKIKETVFPDKEKQTQNEWYKYITNEVLKTKSYVATSSNTTR